MPHPYDDILAQIKQRLFIDGNEEIGVEEIGVTKKFMSVHFSSKAPPPTPPWEGEEFC